MEIGELTFIGFCSLAALNALFFAAYLWFKRGRNITAGIILSVFMLITAYRIAQMLLHDLQDDFKIGINLRTVFFFIPTFPLIGPMLYLYIKSITVKDFQFKIKHLLHLMPFFVFFLTDILNRGNFPLSPDNRRHYITYCIQISIIAIQFLIYLIISYKYAQRQIKGKYEERFPNEKMNPGWIKNIVLIISILWLIYAMYCIQTFARIYIQTRIIEALYYSLFSYWILYNELRDQRITNINSLIARYKFSGLSTEDAVRYKSMILDYISKNELYKNHDVTLGRLAKNLSMTPHILSQVVNEQFYCNFNDLINKFRIEEAKRLLKNPGMSNITIAGIAYDSGFNTLSAFNTAFRKFTGVTPSQFRNRKSQ
ncbi:MAG: AraC family transcriptional regulator [Bacteroidales bacterium]|nr:AraC family transcriptional regulator [Bacteroidales bacterium]